MFQAPSICKKCAEVRDCKKPHKYLFICKDVTRECCGQEVTRTFHPIHGMKGALEVHLKCEKCKFMTMHTIFLRLDWDDDGTGDQDA